MQRILLTGMSGTGKSTIIQELASRGYRAVDLDSVEFSMWAEVPLDSAIPGTPVEPTRDWIWREDQVEELLSMEGADILFVSGCASNMARFLGRFDQVVLLRAPFDVIAQRLQTRTDNQYGKSSAEVRRVLGLLETVEPLLRRVADFEIDTTTSLDDVVGALLGIAYPPS